MFPKFDDPKEFLLANKEVFDNITDVHQVREDIDGFSLVSLLVKNP